MALPITELTKPAALKGQANGKLDPSILTVTGGQDGGPDVRLVKPAARAWRAMSAAALDAGHVLKASGPSDSYRPYEVQEKIFRQRYTTDVLAGRPRRSWQGRWWYQRPGTAAAAVPGTSNHGWGLAVDIGEELDGDAGTESITAGTVAWLVANARRFGFSAELQSEPWHWRYVAGDRIPDAVLAHDGPVQPEEDDMPPPPEIFYFKTPPDTLDAKGEAMPIAAYVKEYGHLKFIHTEDQLGALKFAGAVEVNTVFTAFDALVEGISYIVDGPCQTPTGWPPAAIS